MPQETVEQLREQIARIEEQVRQYEARMAVHPENLDDKKKGRTCRNYIARATFKKERDRYALELAEHQARLDAELGSNCPVAPADQPSEATVLDFVI